MTLQRNDAFLFRLSDEQRGHLEGVHIESYEKFVAVTEYNEAHFEKCGAWPCEVCREIAEQVGLV